MEAGVSRTIDAVSISKTLKPASLSWTPIMRLCSSIVQTHSTHQQWKCIRYLQHLFEGRAWSRKLWRTYSCTPRSGYSFLCAFRAYAVAEIRVWMLANDHIDLTGSCWPRFADANCRIPCMLQSHSQFCAASPLLPLYPIHAPGLQPMETSCWYNY